MSIYCQLEACHLQMFASQNAFKSFYACRQDRIYRSDRQQRLDWFYGCEDAHAQSFMAFSE